MELTPAISIVGRKNAGKTTLIERLIPELASRGLRIATIKHDAHDFEIDIAGKDTWRHREAGSRLTIIASPHQTASVRLHDREPGLRELLELVDRTFDLVLVEGYRSGPLPKIVVGDDAPGEVSGDVLAVVSNGDGSGTTAPRLRRDQVAELADLIQALLRSQA